MCRTSGKPYGFIRPFAWLLLLSLALLLAASCGQANEEPPADTQPEETEAPIDPSENEFRPAVSARQKFKTYCPYSCVASNGESGGLLIYCGEEGCIPYVLIERNRVAGFDPTQYLEEVYRPYLEQYYGKDLLSVGEVAVYAIGGRELPGCLYSYRVEESVVEMLCVFLVTGDESVTFTAKYVQGRMEEVTDVFDAVIRYYRPTGELPE